MLTSSCCMDLVGETVSWDLLVSTARTVRSLSFLLSNPMSYKNVFSEKNWTLQTNCSVFMCTCQNLFRVMRFKHEFILNSIRVLEWIWQIFIFCIYICITRNLFLFRSGYFNMIWLNYLGIRDLNLFLCLLLQNANITAIFNKTFYNCISPTMIFRSHI